jgi:hypothetical protein
LTWENVVNVGASSSSIPDNGARKIFAGGGVDDINHRLVGNPKRKV